MDVSATEKDMKNESGKTTRRSKIRSAGAEGFLESAGADELSAGLFENRAWLAKGQGSRRRLRITKHCEQMLCNS